MMHGKIQHRTWSGTESTESELFAHVSNKLPPAEGKEAPSRTPCRTKIDWLCVTGEVSTHVLSFRYLQQNLERVGDRYYEGESNERMEDMIDDRSTSEA
jgi:hypothetical protein